MKEQIENYIDKNLSGEMKQTALDFVSYLKKNGLTFYRDTCDCWKEKIYYWVKFGEECVCFIAIKDPDEPENFWTVWSDECAAYESKTVGDDVKVVGWSHVDFCGNCGSCGGGREKVIFGRRFPGVCGCTFRIDNAVETDLPFLKEMADLRIKELMNNNVIDHYDRLIDENNDPVRDPQPLREYMDKWDGQEFIDEMELDKAKSVLEIGVGTGRLAVRTAPFCGDFCGIDISPKTVKRAEENLSEYKNATLICGDFLNFRFDRSFDIIYSSLTFMHIKDKRGAVNKIARLLNHGGRFILSLDKNKSEFIDTGTSRIKIYPDEPDTLEEYIKAAGLTALRRYETEHAFIIVSAKH